MHHRRLDLTRSVAAAAIFGAVSFVLAAASAPYLPRMPGWGIAFVDPVSIVWVISFLVFGVYTGLLCSIIGTLGLLFFDPTTPLGPIMKLIATLPIILSLNYGLTLYRGVEHSGSSLKSLRIYIPLSALGTAIRVVVMIGVNVLLFLTLFDISHMAFSVGMINLSAWNAVIMVAALINVEQSIWDCAIPYLAIYKTKFYERFAVW